MFKRSSATWPLYRVLCALLLTLVSRAPAQTGLFPNPTVIPTGNWPAAVYTADINGDGIPDLIYFDPPPARTLHRLLNDGHGRFTALPTAMTFSGISSLAIDDFEQTGQLWPAVISLLGSVPPGSYYACPSLAEIDVLEGSIANGFVGNDAVCLSGSNPPKIGNLASARLRNGLPPDILFTDAANGMLYSANIYARGIPSFFNVISIPLPHGAGPITSADLNGDGYLDLIVNGQTPGVVDVYLGTAAGPGRVPITFTGTGPIHSILIRDVNNDGRPDLIAEGPNGRIDVFPGNGDGTFQTTSIGGTGTLDGLTGNGGHLIALADLNHDGQLDALTSTPIGVSALLGQGTAYLGLKGIFNAGPGMHTFASADFNGDGNLDLATDSPEGIAILYGNSDGTFQTSQAFAAGAPAESGALGVFTPSGHLDAAVAINSRQAQFLRGNGDGTFQFFSQPATPAIPQPTTSLTGTPGFFGSIAVGDFDNDGKPDLAVTADGPPAPAGASLPSQGILLQYGKGDGTFAPSPGIVTNINAGAQSFYGTSVAAPGVGLGGVPGLLNLDAGYLWSIANEPSTSYAAATLLADVPSHHPHNLLATGSLRQAGLNDLIAEDGGSLKVFLNNGQAFSPTPLGDLAVDGSLTTPGQRTAPDISSTFGGLSQALGFHAAIGSMRITDVDRDGHADLLVLYDDLDADHTAPTPAALNYLYLWFGDGTGHFPVTAAHPVNPVRIALSRNYYEMEVADLNNDGKPDLILSDGYLISVQFGDGTGSFGPEQHFLAGQGINSISNGNLRSLALKGLGPDRFDLVVSNGGTVFGNPVANKDVLTPNPDVNTGGITVLLTNPQAALPVTATTGSLNVSPEPSAFEAPVTLTALLDATSPTGTVAFSVAGIAAGSSPVVPTPNLLTFAATLTLAAPYPAYLNGKPLLPGSYPLTAVYSGDSTDAPVTLTGTHTVLLGPTSVTLTPTTPLQSFYGQPIDGTFAVNVVDPAYPATGTYTVLDNGVPVAICTNLPLNRNGQPTICPYGNPIFLDAGPHSFSVTYNGGPANGDLVNDSSTSASIPYNTLPDVTTAGILTSSTNPSVVGQTVTFTATFTSNVAVPTGTVTFLDGSSVIGSGTLNAAGQASFTTANLTVGTHPVSAAYAGTGNFLPAHSATLNQIVLPVAVAPPPAFTLTVTPNPVTLGTGRTAVLLVTVTGPLATQLTCADSFTESACTFLQTTLPTGGGATTLQVSTAAPHDCSDPAHPYFLGRNPPGPGTPGAVLAAVAACVLLARKRRKLAGLVLTLAGLFALGTLGGCGHCTDLGTRPGNYSFSVTATATDGSTRQVTVPIRVTIPGE